MKYSLLLLFALFVGSALSVQLTKCQVYNYLRASSFPSSEWARFTCIALYESSYNTEAVNTQTWDYGLLQISSIYWCNDGVHQNIANGCNTQCSALFDVNANIRCAYTVYSIQGATAWTAYTAHRSECDNFSVSDCGSTSGTGGGCGTYTVVSGDTLYHIAHDIYHDAFTWQTLCSYNNLANCNALSVGQVLRIPNC